MPALKQDYDYYEYARRRQGAVRNTASVSRPTYAQNAVHRPTRDETKMATRRALSEEFIGGKSRKAVSRNTGSNTVRKNVTRAQKNEIIEPVVFNKKEQTQKKEQIQKPQEMKLTKPKAKPNTSKKLSKQKAKDSISGVFLTTCLFAMFFFICYRYTTINEAFNDVNEIKSNLRNKETVNAQLESSIKQNTDLSYIENYAKYQLGMQKPKASQIQRIVIDKEDKITTPIEIIEEEGESSTNNLFADLLKILD